MANSILRFPARSSRDRRRRGRELRARRVLPKRTRRRAALPPISASRSIAHQVDSFLAFHADGSVTIYTSKVDVGTGLRIAMSQMAAEELGIPVERVSLVEGDTALVPDHGGTGGSTGVPRGGVDVRQAAATARQAILNLGAAQLKRPRANSPSQTA